MKMRAFFHSIAQGCEKISQVDNMATMKKI